jgi:hypothetical protein
VSGPGPGARRRAPAGSETASVTLVPSLVLRHGRVCRPGPNGPEDALTAAGTPPDPFDVIDRIVRDYSLLYLVDLDGTERSEPQLDYIQEFSRDIDLWVDGGVRTADQSIDILVAGAKRAVVSSEMLEGPEELERAFGLSTELVFEIPFSGGRMQAGPKWPPGDAAQMVRAVREIGVGTVILSPRDSPPNWSFVRWASAGGPTWVDGTFDPRDAARLLETGAAGGIFRINAIPEGSEPLASAASPRQSPTPRRDDED